MSKILVSSCLLGYKVRYDGNDNLQNHPRLLEWIRLNRVVFICPEMAGGLSTPREASEIESGYSAQDVINNKARILTKSGNDVTQAYLEGAHKTLAYAKKHEVSVALLKARSPSCGSKKIYDGTFSGNLIDGMGLTAALLTQNCIQVFDETEIDLALNAAED